ncbi:MAG: DNA polymerase III subunit beta [Candidatus Dojkabacteria bacterium]|nr:DNA polymerase III subunit beta [Candidatus Dojkabacteria bacterium]
MKFSCNQDTFSKYLNIMSRVVSNKPGLPILNNVYFEATKGKLVMKTTDLELSISTWIGADVENDGKITLPAKQLSEFVNSVPQEKIDVTVERQNFNISTSNNSASFNTMPPDDFPNIPSVEKKEEPFLQINSTDFLLAVNRVAFAAATDDIKPVLTGVKIEIKDNGTASFVATDGLRLSKQDITIEKGIKNKDFLVPVRALLELSYIVNEVGEEAGSMVSLFLIEDKNQVMFRVGDIDIISRLIDGEFPEYEQIIPTGYKTKCNVDREEFLNSLKIVNIIARSVLGNKMVLQIQSKENRISLSAVQSDLGKNESNFECKVEGDNLKIAFSSKLLSDILNHIDSEKILFECSEAIRPGVFKIDDDNNFIHLVMPMML